jgi:ComF family protein
MVCGDCAASLPLLRARCVRCALPLGAPGVCGQCLRGRAHFDGAFAAFEYRCPVDRLVQRFKYAGDLAIGRWLSCELARRLDAQERPHLLVPMPLTPARLRERGFNQAAQIARVVSKSLRVPAALGMVERVREAPSQSGLGRKARRANLRGAFRCRASLRGRHVALVDDVITTGASADAVCAVLKRAGASRVDVWAIARTPDPGAR